MSDYIIDEVVRIDLRKTLLVLGGREVVCLFGGR
jgi:hypothetical protein